MLSNMLLLSKFSDIIVVKYVNFIMVQVKRHYVKHVIQIQAVFFFEIDIISQVQYLFEHGIQLIF